MLPKNLQAQLDVAMKHHLAGRLGAAVQIYERLFPSAPGSYEINHMGGLAFLQLGRYDKALVWLERARHLNPRAPTTWMLLGLVHKNQSRFPEAEAALRESLKLAPRSGETWANLGALFVHLNRLDETIDCFRKAVDLNPKDASSWAKLASAYLRQGRMPEALECNKKALALDPRDPAARRGLAEVFQAQCKTEQALVELEAHLANYPRDLGALSMRLMLLNYRSDLSPSQLFEQHRAYGRIVEGDRAAPTPVLPNPPVEDRRLRVGFLSPDFRCHSVAYFIRPFLECLDPARFELFLYHDHFNSDSVTEEFKRLVPQWRQVYGQDNDLVEKKIRGDAIDILVDLAGHTSQVRLPLFARRVAPVQITYLGYPNTTGLSSMDYRLVDPVSDPEGEANALCTEKLLRFSSCAWCYEPPSEAPEPATRGEQEPICFGSFNAFFKLNGATLELWKRVLERVPRSTLLLKCIGADLEAWRARLSSQGFDLSRVTLLPHHASVADHMACYSKVDIGLDPFPYNGTTTTCEALWMGVPVITLRGNRHASRVGASLLGSIGLQELVAGDPDDYVELAARLAADRPRLHDLRTGMRGRLKGSALLDKTGQAARLGEAFLQVWRRYCAASGKS
jgi:predicted O-linked N-acetylglucosamine transferase (SPINDLY family)